MGGYAWKLRNTHRRYSIYMSFDVMEEGTPCDYCGQPVRFIDDDWAVCPSCRAEYINMDFEGGDLEGESPLEY
jgi:predicted amidophosphoribosyltransferase